MNQLFLSCVQHVVSKQAAPTPILVLITRATAHLLGIRLVGYSANYSAMNIPLVGHCGLCGDSFSGLTLERQVPGRCIGSRDRPVVQSASHPLISF